jgi:hypothetical protein
MADPAALHAAQVFGDWSLPDRSGPNRTAIEDQLANLSISTAGRSIAARGTASGTSAM